jgi:glyoxylase-like metal-dependent hydrolase (beta-lactamase superfamily II)
MQIHTIDLEFQSTGGTIASFLIESADGLILIEPGPGSTTATLLRKIGALGFDADQVRSVFVTHVHLDHAGAAGWWAQRGADLYVHPKAARHLIDPSKLIESAKLVYGDAFDSLWGEILPTPEEKVRILEDGETVELGGITIEAIDTPGHAFHHHAFAIGEVCFTGDVAGARLQGAEYISVTSAPPQFHPESYLASIDRLVARDFSTLYLTHFGAVDDVDDHLARYRAAVSAAAEIVKALIDSGEDEESIRVAYGAFQMEQAFKSGLPRDQWDAYQKANGTDMSADGLRMYWERKALSATA